MNSRTHFRSLRSAALAIVVAFAANAATARADNLSELLKQPVLKPGEATQQHKQYVLARIPELKLVESAEAWQIEAAKIRQRVLEEVVFRGVSERWRAPNPRIEWLGEIKTEHGYSIRKLRYEALPGLWIPALLYQPDELQGKVPVVLNVNGHDGNGKAAAYKQIRCINQAKRGILALNVEWIGMGQLRAPGYSHNDLAKLDLCGQSGLAVFFLAMSRGIDVLLSHEHADRERLAVTGLSGGGWQTIILSSLDSRVKLSVPVAGYSALAQRVDHRSSIGDLEQNPSDLVSIADYAHLTALMAPRPTLLIYNQADNCCFASPTVKPNTFDPVVPFFEQAGAGQKFAWHNNVDPGTHNYELDNRQQLYRFLNRHFLLGKDTIDNEIASDEEVKTAEELHVELPQENATFHSLAAAASADLPASSNGKSPREQRAVLRELLRLEPLTATAETIAEAAADEATLERLRIELGDEWTLPAVVVARKDSGRVVVLVADAGFAAHAEKISSLAADGARVVCVDPVLIGQAAPGGTLYQNAQLIATVGRRPLGVQTAQLLAAIELFAQRLKVEQVDVISHGPRTGLAALCAAALDGGKRIGSAQTVDLPDSLKSFVKPGASYNSTPEVFCFGLLEQFDIPQLRALGPKR